MRNRRRHGRRGLSTVITTLLMVAAVSIMGAALMSWSSSSFAAQQLAISNQTDSRINLIKEDFIIEDVWFFDNGTKYANMTIRNTGEIALTVSNVYINNTEITNFADQVILANSVAEIDVQTNWGSGKSQSIWIHTARGADVKQVWKS